MIGDLLLIGVCVAIPIGFGVFADRSPPERLHRMSDWPLKNMPTTNGALFGLLFIGAMTALFYGLGTIAHVFKWV